MKNNNKIIYTAPYEDDNPIPGLRGYQSGIYKTVRTLLSQYRSVCVQSATGSGKTIVFVAMVNSVFGKNKRAWILVPREELMSQASAHLTKWGVIHNRIDPKHNESLAYKIHIVSKDTLTRRWEKIKNWPDLIIIDEAHINYDFQLEIMRRAPEYVKFIGYTATSERLDSRGLWSGVGGPWNCLVKGPEIPWLTEHDYLVDLKYFSPPLDGLEEIKKKGLELDSVTLEEFLKAKKVFGQAVEHYEANGKGKAAVGFCYSVESAYKVAETFQKYGYKFYCIEGGTAKKKRKAIIDALTAGEIDGITCRDIMIYGIDIPRLEYGFSLRYTFSLAIYMQLIGRLLRPFTDKKTGYKKEYAIMFDHANMIKEHGIPITRPDGYTDIVPPHWAPEIYWNFSGKEKRQREKKLKNPMICPFSQNSEICKTPDCRSCDKNPDKTVKDVRKPMIVIDTQLTEKQKPIKFNNLPYEERREFQDNIGMTVAEYKAAETQLKAINPDDSKLAELEELMNSSLVKLIALADERGWSMLWVYHRLTLDSRMTVNVPLLHAIARIKGYKPGWAYMKGKEIKEKFGRKAG